jgi:Protein of unknown function (DUF3485)
MSRYLPVVLGILLIVGLTIPQIQMTDRLSGSNVSAEQRAELLSKVPMKVGDWVGQDMAIDPNVKKTAGAIGAVQRDYHNTRTGEKVGLWLIVGHARDVSYHTPDVCYPGQGFEARATENSVYPMEFPDKPELGKTDFLTNTFIRESSAGQRLVRVFWNWYNPENKENPDKVVWEAPKNARWHFGNTRSLYKMYFTGAMRDPKETAEQSACVRFGRDFLPEVNKALAAVQLGVPAVDQGGKPVEQATPPVSSAEAEKAAIKEAKEAAPADTGGAGQVEGGLPGSEKAEPKAK